MAEINVTFWGICTYIRDRRRFVLVNAASREIIESHPKLQGLGIDPHYALLHIHAEDVVSIGPLPLNEAPGGMLRFELNQVTLTIANPELPAEVLAEANMCAPHLKHYTEELGPPNDATVTGGPSMAAFFDIVQGELRSFRKKTPDGACVNVLTSQTVGEPVLTITPFGTTSTSAITLRSGASVLITNLPDPSTGADREVDFLLHFLTADVIPTVDKFPRGERYSDCDVSVNIEDGGIGLYVGPGCSNTNYP